MKMAILPAILLFIIISGIVVTIISVSLRKGISGLKLMLLGINITLVGGIIAVDPNSNLGGIEYLVVLIGMIFSIIGLGKKDKDSN
jgi:hypothetical protein